MKKQILVITVLVLATIIYKFAYSRIDSNKVDAEESGMFMSNHNYSVSIVPADDFFCEHLENGIAVKEYFHCVLSPFESGLCYPKIRKRVEFCFEDTDIKLTESDLEMIITGGIMDEMCSDVKATCHRPLKGRNPDDVDQLLIDNCQNKLSHECSLF